ncbi:flagellar M-ring protein FliF [Escherichia coli]|nr:flagellar M-ring protein FliF [Escherichia coli]
MNATAAQTKSLEWLNRLRANPKIPLIVAGSAAVAVMVALILWAKAPDYRTLFSNLSDQDGGAIVSQLTQMNIPYRFSEASGAIEVPAEKVHELRLRLAQQGLPKGGAVGFELLDQEKFGISQFSEQVNYQRALEGELSRTIATIGPVKGARVHLAMPKPSLFVREQKSPSASVTVNLLPGRALDEGQISAIVHLVSSAVAGLPPGNVTLVDQGGHLLTQSNTSGRDLNDAQLKYASDVEGRIQRRIEAILSPIVGNGNIHAQVTAQLDFASKEQTEEQYRPNGDESHAALRSRQLNESEQSGSGYPGGVQPAALAELTEVLNGLLDGQNLKRSKMGGVRTAAEIINLMKTQQEEAVITAVREFDGELAQKIIDEMFLFENLVDVDDRSIQRLLQEVDSESLLIALKGAEQPLREKFLRNMSQRAADILRDDLANRGPVRLSQVENEQKAILLIVRRLAETGEMVIGSGEDTYV